MSSKLLLLYPLICASLCKCAPPSVLEDRALVSCSQSLALTELVIKHAEQALLLVDTEAGAGVAEEGKGSGTPY